MTTRRNIAFFGIKRSGNHALQNWILHQIPEKTCVFNQAEIGGNPLHVHHFRIYQDMQLAYNGRRLFGGTYDGPVENNSIFYTYENIELPTITDGISMGRNNLLSMGPFDYSANIMVLRDPFNMLASLFIDYKRAEAPRMWPPPDKYISLWKAHAKEFLGVTSYLKSSSDNGPLKVCISYNDWFTSEEYRKSVSNNLQLEFNDNGLQYVNRFGEGSSFDDQKYMYEAQKMKVLERWKQLENYPEWKDLFNKLLADDELVGLAKEIFHDHMAEIMEERQQK